MKFYPNADVWFCCEQSNIPQRYGPDHSWKLQDKTTTNEIRYWRDIEGVKKMIIKDSDLYSESWPKTRIRKEACLPLLYATGYRFIRLSKMGPAGFKCAPIPVNLATAQVLKVHLAKQQRKEQKAAKKAKAEEKRAKAEAKKKAKEEAEKAKKKAARK